MKVAWIFQTRDFQTKGGHFWTTDMRSDEWITSPTLIWQHRSENHSRILELVYYMLREEGLKKGHSKRRAHWKQIPHVNSHSTVSADVAIPYSPDRFVKQAIIVFPWFFKMAYRCWPKLPGSEYAHKKMKSEKEPLGHTEDNSQCLQK